MSNDEPEIKRKEEARRRCRSLSSPPRRKHPTRTKTGDSQTSDTAFTTKYKCLISFNSIFSFSTFQTGRKCNNPVKSQTQNISQCFCFYLSIILIFFSEIVDGFVTKIGDWSFPILNFLKFFDKLPIFSVQFHLNLYSLNCGITWHLFNDARCNFIDISTCEYFVVFLLSSDKKWVKPVTKTLLR